MSFSVSGNKYSSERVTPVEPAVKSTQSAGGRASIEQESSPPSDLAHITKLSELRKAEMQGEDYTISEEQVVKAIERAIKSMQGKSTSLEFSVHEKTKLISVKVKDKDTGEIIREIPPEKTLDFVANLWEMAGIFIDEKR